MLNVISMQELVAQEGKKLEGRKPKIILDTNSWRYAYSSDSHEIIATTGVMEELVKFRDIFPPESIERLTSLLNPKIEEIFPTELEEYLILDAAAKRKKSSRKIRDIGWIDTQQIAYAMRQALKEEPAIILSNDGDILKTISKLRKTLPYMKQHSLCVSPQRYLERKYAGFLATENKSLRRSLLKEIELHHLIAA